MKNNLKQGLKILKEFLKLKNLKTINIAITENVEGIHWRDITELLQQIFKGENITIIACKGALKYVPKEERESLFNELHSSPIGGHRVV